MKKLENNKKRKRIKDFFNKYFSNNKKKRIKNKTIKISRKEIDNLIGLGESLENLLNKIKDKGYIFHGSPRNIKELEPKEGKCSLGGKINKLNAVYAINQPSIAIFHAVMPWHKIKGKFIKEWHGNKHIENSKVSFSIIFKMNKAAYEDFLNNPHNGYVYLLEQKDFKQIDPFQFINEKKYIPVYKIFVKKRDFNHKIEIIKK